MEAVKLWRALAIVIVAAFCFTVDSRATTGEAQALEASAARDRAVIQAVLDHTVRPESRRLSGAAVDRLPVLANSVSACASRHDKTCVTPEQIARALTGQTNPSPMWTTGPIASVALPDANERASLTALFVRRNSERVPLPFAGFDRLELIAREREPDMLVRDRDTSRFAGFSLPAYSDRHAVTYAFYACGRCGSGWVFVLENQRESWSVISRYMVWIG